jgi:hypothetical protein
LHRRHNALKLSLMESICTYSTKTSVLGEKRANKPIERKNNDIRQRLMELQDAQALKYPRIKPDRNAISCAEFRARYAALSPEESRESDNVTLRGTLNDVPHVSIADRYREAVLFKNRGFQTSISRRGPGWDSGSRVAQSAQTSSPRCDA